MKVLKRLTSGIMAAAVLVAAAGMTPSSTASAAANLISTATSLSKVTSFEEVTCEIEDGTEYLRFKWDEVEGAEKYVYHYSLNYDASKKIGNTYATGETEKNYADIEISGELGANIWIEVAPSKADETTVPTSRFVSYTCTKEAADAAVEAARVQAKADAVKPGKVVIKSAQAFVGADAVGVQYNIKKVKGADGYQYKANMFYKSGGKFEKAKTTKKTKIKVGFQDNDTVAFKVRAYRINSKGKKVYGRWTTKVLTRQEIQGMMANLAYR